MNDELRDLPDLPDLSDCAREPIHIPGAIQPHGALVALSDRELSIVAASANLVQFSGIDAAAVLGGPASILFDPDTQTRLRALLERDGLNQPGFLPVRFATGSAHPAQHCAVHRHDGLVFLEVEAAPEHRPAPASDDRMVPALSEAIGRMQAARDTAVLGDQLVHEIRRLTGFDRVKLYRFYPDWTGEVVAEDRADSMPGFLGLHFPASDIPAQARDLYRRNPSRIIPSVAYHPVPLLVDPMRGDVPVDLSFAQLRSVSPVHLGYLRNMGVGASMSVSVLRDGALWGLIACHSAGPLHVGPERRHACRLLAQVLSWQLAVAEEADAARHSAAARGLLTRVVEETAPGVPFRESMLQHSTELLEQMQAHGLALIEEPDAAILIGATPDAAAVSELAGWLATRDDAGSRFETNRLGALYPPATAYADVASGVLAVPLSHMPRQWMIWFRREVAQTVVWGGDPRKPVDLAPNGADRLTPRRSFAEWTETVRGRARPWQPREQAAATELRDLVMNVLARRAQELAHVNAQLARINQELEAFAYIASHDIREPLRQIETFASMLDRSIGAGAEVPDERIARWVDGIESSSRRLRRLIDDLTDFSRLAREGQPLAPAALSDIWREAGSDLALAMAEAGAVVDEPGRLPRVLCDRVQVRRVLQNLLSNAIKYRHPDRVLHISLSTEPASSGSGAAHRAQASGDMVRISLRDNGIGFDPRYATRILEPFQRLHDAEHYPGSGIGLAICRKIVERHGGAMVAEGRAGEGATISFTLPAAPGTDP